MEANPFDAALADDAEPSEANPFDAAMTETPDTKPVQPTQTAQAAQPTQTRDPFASVSADPFDTGAKSDPFATAAPAATSDPFATDAPANGATSDPFGTGADDPFATGAPATSGSDAKDSKKSAKSGKSGKSGKKSGSKSSKSTKSTSGDGPAGEADPASKPIQTMETTQGGGTQGAGQKQVQLGAGMYVAVPNHAEAVKMAKLRPGPCCTLTSNEDNKPAAVEFFLVLAAGLCQITALCLDSLAEHKTASLDQDCGMFECESKGCFSLICFDDSDEQTETTWYIDSCDETDDFDALCDTFWRGFFWMILSFLSFSTIGYTLFIYLQRDCKCLAVECPSFKCGSMNIAYTRRQCLYLIIATECIVLTQVCAWCIGNYLFDEDEIAYNFDIGLSIWLNIISMAVLAIGLLHGFYRPIVFAKNANPFAVE